MSGQTHDLAERYGQLGEQELLNLARDYDSLTDVAQTALRSEFARRNMPAPLVERDDEDIAEGQTQVTSRSYRDLPEAMIARAMLESAGITVTLRDENVIRMGWHLSNLMGGIRLEVEKADAAAAEALLEQPIPASIPFDPGLDAEDDEYLQPHCPSCGSLDVSYESKLRGAAVASLYTLGIPLPTGPKAWRCHACNTRWVDQDDASGSES
jgi:hypothetical protein